ncbi:hypothetical protein EBZ39_00915 [bacterium]|nr:hypothetical protein [bacterium]
MAQPPIPSYLNTNLTVNRSQAEQAIYLELEGDSRFPAVSVTHFQYPDKTEAFPGNINARPLSSVEVFPKFATLNYIVNPEDVTYGLLAQDGFIVADNTSGQVNGTFSTIQVISACKFQGLTATSSSTSKITAYELPQNFSLTGPITNFTLTYGAVVAYKNN